MEGKLRKENDEEVRRILGADLDGIECSNTSLKSAVNYLKLENATYRTAIDNLLTKVKELEKSLNLLSEDNALIKNELKVTKDGLNAKEIEIEAILESRYLNKSHDSSIANPIAPVSPIRKKSKPNHQPPSPQKKNTKLLENNPYYVLDQENEMDLENPTQETPEIAPVDPVSPTSAQRAFQSQPTAPPQPAPASDSPRSEQMALQLPMMEPDDEAGFTKVTRPNRHLPPITIKNFGQWTILNNELKLICKEKFSAKTFGEEIKIKFTAIDDYRAAAHLFEARKIQHVVFHINSEPLIRVVLKRVHESISIEDIKQDIEDYGMTIHKISRLKKSPLNTAPALILVQLPNSTKNKEIFGLTEILGTAVMVETFKKRSDIIQCYNCQGFHHGSQSCHMLSRCVKCGKPHPTNQCKQPRDSTPKCANCLGAHVASFRGCPKFPPNPAHLNKPPVPRNNPPQQTAESRPQVGPNKSLFSGSVPVNHAIPNSRPISYAAAVSGNQTNSNASIISKFEGMLAAMAESQATMMSTFKDFLSAIHG